ncbi:hypothetical protein HAP48_0037290 [Bradyrhizobium septentrionale]|uniref:Uncharacterized protein n=1 Tax=Bradyrhizobium septentrionale TaxID=1404411 RepID=A0A973W192_9BRAD|nr:hypothetical protein [Bradyrhizobium septentrionale]UGY14172.1 hypothetical protein HAP48_0037290 [Bradyrhizobium septentrionale]
MEKQLILNLLAVARAFATSRGIELSTVGRVAAGDWRFFDHISDGAKTFTARKYDLVMVWFSENWPAGEAWPEGVARPNRAPQ